MAAVTAALVAVFDLAALAAGHTAALAAARTVVLGVAHTAASGADMAVDMAEDTADSRRTPILIDWSHDLVLALVVADGRRDQAASG